MLHVPSKYVYSYVLYTVPVSYYGLCSVLYARSEFFTFSLLVFSNIKVLYGSLKANSKYVVRRLAREFKLSWDTEIMLIISNDWSLAPLLSRFGICTSSSPGSRLCFQETKLRSTASRSKVNRSVTTTMSSEGRKWGKNRKRRSKCRRTCRSPPLPTGRSLSTQLGLWKMAKSTTWA